MYDESAKSLKLVVGLGNPGKRYAKTRHNIGFQIVDRLVARWNITNERGAFGGKMFETRLDLPDGQTQKVILLKPHTFMNCSGQAVKGLTSFYQAKASDVMIVLDDMAIQLGTIRARAKGSAGGHNGLKDIMLHLGTQDIPRLRVGIGAAPQFMDTKDFVLSRFAEDEHDTVEDGINQAADAVADWVANDIVYVMDNYNNNNKESGN